MAKKRMKPFTATTTAAKVLLWCCETDKSYGKKGSKAVTTKQGYTYDRYRNVLTEKSSKAYLAKNRGKEHLYTTTYTYHGTGNGYPSEDQAYSPVWCLHPGILCFRKDKNQNGKQSGRGWHRLRHDSGAEKRQWRSL